ncbi:hypothetical protein LY474_32280 [Myxococcus stipitatus]|uniref:hypothetical protein n=1 Tax=Myxococcus stipitatus TaxID=83455 RepID=UPI001F2128CA|nr:hypothetical protein [Myxococcus stipitatus]MCE9672496.1 hypothetical protein [Myxococcus stipitatus]
MSTTREQLRRMVAERKPPSGGFAWSELMEALEQMEQAPEALATEDADVLLDLLSQRGRLPLRGQPPVPHSMPPEELLQYRALKLLHQAGRLDAAKDSLRRLEQEPVAPALRQLARTLLNPDGHEEEA